MPGMFSSSGAVQPDGSEGLAKRKGVVVRQGLKEADREISSYPG